MFEQLSLDGLFQKLEELEDRVPLATVQAILQHERAASRLRAVLRDESYWDASGDGVWMPLYAVKLLGVLKTKEDIPELTEALTRAVITDHEWIMEDLPAVLGALGSTAIDPLRDYILKPPDPDLDEEDRW